MQKLKKQQSQYTDIIDICTVHKKGKVVVAIVNFRGIT